MVTIVGLGFKTHNALGLKQDAQWCTYGNDRHK